MALLTAYTRVYDKPNAMAELRIAERLAPRDNTELCLFGARYAASTHDNEAVTEQAIRALVARGTPLVAILWGRDAQTLRPLLGPVPRIESAHPSPLSADRGFFGSRPFSRANALLAEQGGDPVDWTLE